VLAAPVRSAEAPPPQTDGLAPLTVVTDDNYPPYIFRNRDGKLEGYVVDAWALWERKTGRKVNLVATDWADAQKIMAAGQADVIDTIFQTAERTRIFDFTPPYADIPVPIFVHGSIGGITGLPSLSGFVVGVKAGDACIERLKGAGQVTFQAFNSYTELVDAATTGKIKIFCLDEPPADYLLYRAGADRTYYRAFTLYTGQFHRAVRKGNLELLGQIQRGFDAMSGDERKRLRDKWMGTRNELPPVRDVVYGLLAAAIAVGVLAAWALALRYQVRRRTEELDLQRGHLRTLFQTIPDLVWLKDVHGVFLSCNRQFALHVGAAESEIVGKTDDDFVDGDLARAFRRGDQEAMETGRHCAREWITHVGRGKRVLVETTKVPVRDAAGKLIGVLGVARDLTGRMEAEEALRQSEERFRLAMDATADGLWDWNVADGSTYFSPAYFRILGYEPGEFPMSAEKWASLIHADDRDRVVAANLDCIENRCQRFAVEYRMNAKDGSWRWILGRGRAVLRDAEGRALRLIGTHVDITERRQAEETRVALETQLRESQKMEAIGTLAGGIAHDFNNLLAVIIGNVALAQEDVEANGWVAKNLMAIEIAAGRAKELVKQILTFSYRRTDDQENQQLRPILEEALKLLRPTLPAGIDLTVDFTGTPLSVVCNANQIEQVLINLCTNAWHAMERDVGRIEIGLEPVSLGEETTQRLDGLSAGAYARLTVADDGHGMDDATQAHIFEPFFTTKEVGKGTGLGLSVVHGIVKAHRGAIEVRSSPGAGTTMSVYLPIAAISAESTSRRTPPEEVHGRGQRVLFVDDETAMVELVNQMLERFGYRTAGFSVAQEAIDALRAEPDEFDLVVSDFNMPMMSGLDVALEARRIRPDLPVVIIAGHITDELRSNAAAAGVRRIISKPNIVDDLCRVVHDLLSPTANTVKPAIL
jgi:PAS domain S-box-containing protein